ncbi:PD-(D/E)XK nuclease family protein [Pseudochrobactrum algeriensis]|uniref:PD-(D/E)XK nuclease family protein n=1 Tax=Pseudochrobactrum algeriensis TaxID=2834768 RepID=UPI001BCBCCA5|nr:PD-(D/E)XK nuclease family protein [Pseudochrobactrum algeriensis]QVQ36533.1 PD-(D/E)XK nuclease family protein [Pseudochrobactrum algeriensis]QVQ39753.1 PD-(D/E)XK nuclease family protein [Pseudochrobactrum algeriensis]QVQ43673.1 PD-(D/E)XK nuclease family protein [Pseudochrobactrum algeriensis]
MRDADVRCEWNSIDIFILSPKNRWAFIIENKVHSRQHKGQLLKYRERIIELFRVQDASDEGNLEISIGGIFLTLHKEIAEDAEYTSIRYDKICIFLKRYLDQEAYLLSPEVMTFLTHYLHILDELSGMSKERTEMENLARKLYRDHKKVLDFIIEYGAGSDFQLAVHRVLGDNVKRGDLVKVDNAQLMYWGLAKNFVSFLPSNWFDALDRTNRVWPGCENWWAGSPVIVWVEVWSVDDSARGHLKLVAEVGPISDYQLRLSFIEALKSAAHDANMDRIYFQSNATEEGRLYSKFLRENTIAVFDVHDTNEMEKKFRQLLMEFEPEIKLIADIIPQLLDYGKLKE